MMLVAVIALVAGFFGGVVYSSFKASKMQAGQGSISRDRSVADQGSSTAQTDQIKAFEARVKQHPEDVMAWTQLGNLYFDTNQFERAITAYGKSLELNPENANVWTDLGVMYRRNGQPKKAIEAFESAMKSDPSHEVSRFNKGVVLMHDLNDDRGAIQAWEELVKLNPFAKTPNGQLVAGMIKNLKSD